MRMVRFEDESGGFAVDLHPLITVISGLPPHVRERLIHGIAALPSGGDPGGRGEVEVHGVHLDLNRESLELLELDQPLDVVLRAVDLPGGAVVPAASEPGGLPEDAEVGDARRDVDEQEMATEDAERAVEMLRERLEAVQRERDELDGELERVRGDFDSFAVAGLHLAREELADLEARALVEAGEIAEIDEVGEAGEADEVGGVDTHDDAHDDDPAGARERIEARLSYLIEESDRLRRLIRSLEAIDPAPVAEAFEAMSSLVEAGAPTDAVDLDGDPDDADPDDADPDADPDDADTDDDLVDADPDADADAGPDPQARALIDLWHELGEREDALAERMSRPDPALAARDEARAAVIAAEEAMRAPRLDPQVVEELESVHDEIFELSGRTSRLAAMRARRRLEALQQRHQELLERLGFATWSAYIMGIAETPVDPDRVEAYERACIELEDAEERYAAARSTGDRTDPESVELADLRSLLRRRTEDLLGGPYGDDPVAALTEWRPPLDEERIAAPRRPVAERAEPTDLRTGLPSAPHDRPAPAAEVDDEAIESAAMRLWDALAATGATMPDDVSDPREIHALGAGWLEAMEALPQRLAATTADRDAIEAEIAELAVEFEALPPDPEPTPRRGRGGNGDAPRRRDGGSAPTAAELDAARARVAEIEARASLHTEAARTAERIEARQAELAGEARDLHDALDEQEPRLAELRERRVAARNRLRRAEAALAAADAERRERRANALAAAGDGAAAEEIEWYVLARLAQQRSVSFVGSVPLVIDDAFANWPADALRDVFSRLERMGEVIQIVYLTDDPQVGEWARGLGHDRALVLDA